MMANLTPHVQSVIDHISKMAEHRNLSGSDIRTIAAVTLIVYCKASDLDLDEAKHGLDLMWDNSNFVVPMGGKS